MMIDNSIMSSFKTLSHYSCGVVGLLMLVYFHVIEMLAPVGINKEFASDMIAIMSPVILLWGGFFLFSLFIEKRPLGLLRVETVPWWCVSLILLPMTPVVQYVALNHNDLQFSGSLSFFLILLSICALFIVFAPFLLQAVVPFRVLAAVNSSFLFVLFYMPSFALENNWIGRGEIKFQLSLLILVMAIVFGVMSLGHRALSLVLIVFVSSNFLFATIDHRQTLPSPDTKVMSDLSAVGRETLSRRPDIYFLTYDAYVENETMLQYGIDNSSHEETLQASGFKIYRGAYTVDIFSAEAIAPVMDMKHFETYDLPSKRLALSGANQTKDLLEHQGYESHALLSPYMMLGQTPSFDSIFPERLRKSAHEYLLTAVFEGQFRDDLFNDYVFFKDREYSAEEYINAFKQAKRDVLRSTGQRPKFVHAHSALPGHSPFVGKCEADGIIKFEKNLRRANSEMLDDIDTILKTNRESIIIINGDHGPALTGDCHMLKDYDAQDITRLHLQDRWGSFVAIRWPDKSYEDFDDIRVLQDIFPVVFSYLFADDAFLEWKLMPTTVPRFPFFKVYINDGVIVGGKNSGEQLFETATR